MRGTVGSWIRVALILAGSVGAALVPAAPAGAHPFGPPPTALVSASGDRVLIEWGAAPDDAMVVGMAIGVLDDGSLERYLEGPVQSAPPAAKEEELAASPALRDYLLKRIAVTQGGEPCDGAVEPIGDFLTDGARVAYRCPEPVAVVDLRITMLHDVHDAYRTFAITEGPGAPAQSVFTVAAPEQRWDFSATPSSAGAQPWLPLSAGTLAVGGLGLGVLALGAFGLAWRRRSVARR